MESISIDTLSRLRHLSSFGSATSVPFISCVSGIYHSIGIDLKTLELKENSIKNFKEVISDKIYNKKVRNIKLEEDNANINIG